MRSSCSVVPGEQTLSSVRGGYVDVDLELLTEVKVSFRKPGAAQPELVVRYDLDHGDKPGPFGKTMLRAVHQVGCASGCDEI